MPHNRTRSKSENWVEERAINDLRYQAKLRRRLVKMVKVINDLSPAEQKYLAYELLILANKES